jgi:Family of unknown function (DUF6518)
VSREAGFVLACAAVGACVGVTTQVLQGVLPGETNWAANSLSAWLVVAFGAASRAPRVRSAAAGAVALLLTALVGYEVVVEARFGGGWGPLVSFWAVGAIAGGLVFGPAGWAWRGGGRWAKATGVGLLAALFIAEGVYLSSILTDRTVGVVLVVIGFLVPLVLNATWRQRGTAYLVLLPSLALGAAGYAAMLLVYGRWTGT